MEGIVADVKVRGGWAGSVVVCWRCFCRCVWRFDVELGDSIAWGMGKPTQRCRSDCAGRYTAYMRVTSIAPGKMCTAGSLRCLNIVHSSFEVDVCSVLRHAAPQPVARRRHEEDEDTKSPHSLCSYANMQAIKK